MKKRLAITVVAAMLSGSYASALDLNSVLGALGGGDGAPGAGLIGGTGIALDGLAEAQLLGSTLVSSETADPLVRANILDTPTEDGQVIAAVNVDLLGDVGGIDLGGLLGVLDLGGLTGEGDLLGGVADTVSGLVGGLPGGIGGGEPDNGDLVGGLVGGVVDTVGGLVDGLTGGLVGGLSN